MKIKSLFLIAFYTGLSVTVLLFGACNKDAGIIEKVFTVSKIDRSIDTDFDIVEFSVVNENLVFALGVRNSEFKLFKTSNGGVLWSEINYPNVSTTFNIIIHSIVFFDDNNGAVVINDKAYRTFNGGQSWTIISAPTGSSGGSAYRFIYAGKNENNELILAEATDNSWYDDHIFISNPSSSTYVLVGTINHDGDGYDYCHYSNGKLLYITRDFNDFEDRLYSFDMTTSVRDTVDLMGHIVNDAMYAENRYISVCELGKLFFDEVYTYDWNVDFYNFHDYDYYSIDEIDGYYVTVANKSITSNYRGKWEEVINYDGSAHIEHFRKIQKIDNKNFYISGNDGVFIKASFE
jgi:hypothetical protein